MATDQASPAALSPSRERLVRIAAMIRDAERSAPVAARGKRMGREAALLPFRRPGRRVAPPGRDVRGAVVDLAS